MSPLIPFYNIDCDENDNKALCASEDVKGIPPSRLDPSREALKPEVSMLTILAQVGLYKVGKRTWQDL